MKRTALFMTTLLAALSTSVLAQQPSGGADAGSAETPTDFNTGSNRDEGIFEVFDTNQDDSIDEYEARAGGLGRDYEAMDEDGDGSVTRDEYDVWQQGRYYPN